MQIYAFVSSNIMKLFYIRWLIQNNYDFELLHVCSSLYVTWVKLQEVCNCRLNLQIQAM